MTKQESLILKGIAILFMIYGHLFGFHANFQDILYIGDEPIAHYLSRAMGPVSFYLILGGYGMHYVWTKGDAHRYSRVLKLFIHFWIILIVFVSIGHFINPDRYPGSVLNFIGNFTSWRTTYNSEWWFLFPYVTLSLASPLVFRFFSKFKTLPLFVGMTFLGLCTSYIISRHGSFLYPRLWLYNPFLFLHLMPAFMFGALMQREQVVEKVKDYVRVRAIKNYVVWGVLLVLVAIRCCFDTGAFHGYYTIVFIILVAVGRRWHFVDDALTFLGRHSMNMWLIHSWFCYHLFSKFTYSLKYTLLIFLFVVLSSLLCSIIVDYIAKPFEKMLNRK